MPFIMISPMGWLPEEISSWRWLFAVPSSNKVTNCVLPVARASMTICVTEGALGGVEERGDGGVLEHVPLALHLGVGGNDRAGGDAVGAGFELVAVHCDHVAAVDDLDDDLGVGGALGPQAYFTQLLVSVKLVHVTPPSCESFTVPTPLTSFSHTP